MNDLSALGSAPLPMADGWCRIARAPCRPRGALHSPAEPREDRRRVPNKKMTPASKQLGSDGPLDIYGVSSDSSDWPFLHFLSVI